MTTITRERLLKIQQWRETYGAGSNVMLPAEEAEELARIALASLDAEPVGEVSEKRHGLVMDGTVDLGGKSTYRIIKGEKAMKRLPLGTKFYIAPPAPVVPDGLRQALSNAGIAAPESDEMLAATCEKYIQMLVTWVKDRKPRRIFCVLCWLAPLRRDLQICGLLPAVASAQYPESQDRR